MCPRTRLRQVITKEIIDNGVPLVRYWSDLSVLSEKAMKGLPLTYEDDLKSLNLKLWSLFYPLPWYNQLIGRMYRIADLSEID